MPLDDLVEELAELVELPKVVVEHSDEEEHKLGEE